MRGQVGTAEKVSNKRALTRTSVHVRGLSGLPKSCARVCCSYGSKGWRVASARRDISVVGQFARHCLGPFQIKGGPLRVPPRLRPGAPGVRPLRADPPRQPDRAIADRLDQRARCPPRCPSSRRPTRPCFLVSGTHEEDGRQESRLRDFAPRCRIEPFLHQGGSASRRRCPPHSRRACGPRGPTRRGAACKSRRSSRSVRFIMGA